MTTETTQIIRSIAEARERGAWDDVKTLQERRARLDKAKKGGRG